jgi:cytochrome c oxidase subunit 4
MAELHRTYDQQQHVESHAPYMKVFWTLLVFTLAEYFYAKLMADANFTILVIGLMTMAITKAALVGAYFMHLKFEGHWVFFFLIPAAILATVFVSALYPDIGAQGGPKTSPAEAEEAALAPAHSVPSISLARR